MNDDEILQLFKNSATKEKALSVLMDKYKEQLYWHIRKMVINHDDADDLLQVAFIKIWKNIDNFREESKLYTWMYRIATNETLTFLQRKKKRSLIPFFSVEKELKKNLEADAYFNGDEIQLRLQKAILTLPEKQRIVFNMKYFDDMKYEDMSEILETSVGALKASYHHATKKIESFLTKKI